MSGPPNTVKSLKSEFNENFVLARMVLTCLPLGFQTGQLLRLLLFRQALLRLVSTYCQPSPPSCHDKTGKVTISGNGWWETLLITWENGIATHRQLSHLLIIPLAWECDSLNLNSTSLLWKQQLRKLIYILNSQSLTQSLINILHCSDTLFTYNRKSLCTFDISKVLYSEKFRKCFAGWLWNAWTERGLARSDQGNTCP